MYFYQGKYCGQVSVGDDLDWMLMSGYVIVIW